MWPEPSTGNVVMSSSTDNLLLVEWRAWAFTDLRNLQTYFDGKSFCVNVLSAESKGVAGATS